MRPFFVGCPNFRQLIMACGMLVLLCGGPAFSAPSNDGSMPKLREQEADTRGEKRLRELQLETASRELESAGIQTVRRYQLRLDEGEPERPSTKTRSILKPRQTDPKILRASGTESGGGGSVIRFPEQRSFYLLDRLTVEPGLAKAAEPVLDLHSPNPIVMNSVVELEVLQTQDLGAYRLALLILEAWKNHFQNEVKAPASQGLIHLIEDSLERMAFLKTNRQFSVLPRYHLQPELESQNPEIEMAILYLPLYGSIVSLPTWNRLDLLTQAGLLIHESIRQIQGAYQFHDLSDLQLQALTAQILRFPSASADLDRWLSPRLMALCRASAEAEFVIQKKQAPPSDPQLAISLLKSMLAVNQVSMGQIVISHEQKERSSRMTMDKRSISEPRELLQNLLQSGVLK